MSVYFHIIIIVMCARALDIDHCLAKITINARLLLALIKIYIIRVPTKLYYYYYHYYTLFHCVKDKYIYTFVY